MANHIRFYIKRIGYVHTGSVVTRVFPRSRNEVLVLRFSTSFFWGNVHGYLHHNEQLHLFQNKTDL